MARRIKLEREERGLTERSPGKSREKGRKTRERSIDSREVLRLERGLTEKAPDKSSLIIAHEYSSCAYIPSSSMSTHVA